MKDPSEEEAAQVAKAAAATNGAISAPNGSQPTARALVGQRACAARPHDATDGADGRVASEAGLSNLYLSKGYCIRPRRAGDRRRPRKHEPTCS